MKKTMPHSPFQLCDADVVIVSLEYMGSILKELRQEPVSLLSVHFLRIIIDEGHNMSSAEIGKRIKAERRWLITGTPTPVSVLADIDHLHKLLQFIRDERYGIDKDAWRAEIREPFLALKDIGFERLKMLLDSVMIRSSKSILRSKCAIKDVVIDFSKDSAKSYNALVRIVRRNLIMSDWYDAKHAQSLLNVKNIVAAKKVTEQLLRGCVFGGNCEADYKREEIILAMKALFTKHRDELKLKEWNMLKDPSLDSYILDLGPDDPNDEEEMRYREDLRQRCKQFEHMERNNIPCIRIYRRPKKSRGLERFMFSGKLYRLASAFKNQDGVCDGCEVPSPFPFVTPCGHLLCDDCLTASRTKCVARGCGVKYKLDKNGIPEELIEMQPSLQVKRWREDWSETLSNKVQYLIDRILSLPRKEVWHEGETEPRIHRAKVIVHSEHKEHLQLVAMKMIDEGTLRHAYVEIYMNPEERYGDAHTRKPKRAAEYAAWVVQRFTMEPDLSVLLINSENGAIGLDLNFVQYVFLLKPVLEPANEQQIISRAHRIGCSKDILVERLIMRNSIEEFMLSDLERSASLSGQSFGNGQEENRPMETVRREQRQRKFQSMLRNLKLVHTREELQSFEKGSIGKDKNGVSQGPRMPVAAADNLRTDILNGLVEPVNVVSAETKTSADYDEASRPLFSSLKRLRKDGNDHGREARRARFA